MSKKVQQHGFLREVNHLRRESFKSCETARRVTTLQ